MLNSHGAADAVPIDATLTVAAKDCFAQQKLVTEQCHFDINSI